MIWLVEPFINGWLAERWVSERVQYGELWGGASGPARHTVPAVDRGGSRLSGRDGISHRCASCAAWSLAFPKIWNGGPVAAGAPIPSGLHLLNLTLCVGGG